MPVGFHVMFLKRRTTEETNGKVGQQHQGLRHLFARAKKSWRSSLKPLPSASVQIYGTSDQLSLRYSGNGFQSLWKKMQLESAMAVKCHVWVVEGGGRSGLAIACRPQRSGARWASMVDVGAAVA